MRCKYCFYADVSTHRAVQSFGVMSAETTHALLANIFASVQPGDDITFAFQGGEPTMAGLPYFEAFVQEVQRLQSQLQQPVRVHYALQTNGLVLDSTWALFLARHAFLVGLSLDGDAALHDENRVDAHEKGTHSRIMAAKRVLEQHHVEYNVLWVLTNKCARSPQKAWNFLCANDIHFVQFIPCLDELDSKGQENGHALTPERFASFYTGLFPLWAAAFARGEYRSVKLFDDVCNLLGRGVVTACGLTGRCQNQFVIEADGSVYPCDFFVLDEWCIGNLAHETLAEVTASPRAQTFVQRERPLGAACPSCKFLKLCDGGCPRMYQSMCVGKDTQFCGYRHFLQQCGERLLQIGQQFAR